MSTSDQPLVSVGLPVHNGGDYFSDSVRSLLDQTDRNVELIIEHVMAARTLRGVG